MARLSCGDAIAADVGFSAHAREGGDPYSVSFPHLEHAGYGARLALPSSLGWDDWEASLTPLPPGIH